MKCWHCGGLGAVQPVIVAYERQAKKMWLPFRPEPPGNIRLDHDEHPCPACHGDDNPPTELERQVAEREMRQRGVEVTL